MTLIFHISSLPSSIPGAERSWQWDSCESTFNKHYWVFCQLASLPIYCFILSLDPQTSKTPTSQEVRGNTMFSPTGLGFVLKGLFFFFFFLLSACFHIKLHTVLSSVAGDLWGSTKCQLYFSIYIVWGGGEVRSCMEWNEGDSKYTWYRYQSQAPALWNLNLLHSFHYVVERCQCLSTAKSETHSDLLIVR